MTLLQFWILALIGYAFWYWYRSFENKHAVKRTDERMRKEIVTREEQAQKELELAQSLSPKQKAQVRGQMLERLK